MTHTESQMRQMRLLLNLYRKTTDFDEQWIHCKSFLNALHSLTDTDAIARVALEKYEVVQYAISLRNIFHHQPLTTFGKHQVVPSSMNLKFEIGTPATINFNFSLMISNALLSDENVLKNLRKQSKLALTKLLAKLGGNNLHVENFLAAILATVEHYCKETSQYDDRADSPSSGYIIKV